MGRLNTDARAAYFNRIGYQPHETQLQYHRSKARFRAPCCGRRYGKSLMAARDREPDLLQPKNLGWILGPTYDLGEKEFRVMWNDLIIGLEWGRDKRVKKAYNLRSGEMYIELPNGSRVEVRSAKHPENLVGEALDWVIMSESAKHVQETFEHYIRPALTDKRGSADFPTTPEGYNWYYNFWRMGQNPDFPDYESWRFPSWFNTVTFPGGFDDPEIQLARRTTDEIWFKQEYGAEFAAFVGRIYDEFDEQTHLMRHEFNPNWPNYGCWDWGFTAPLAFVEFQVDPQDNVYVWREHYKSYLMLEEHIELLNRRDNPEGYRLDLTFADGADPEAVRYVNTHFGPCIAEPESKDNWRQGVSLVKQFMKPRHDGISYDEYERPITKPKYFVDHSCENHIREINNYRSKEKPNTEHEAKAAGAALKQDDHTLDAVRYGMVHLFELGYGAADIEMARTMMQEQAQMPSKVTRNQTPRPDEDFGPGIRSNQKITTSMRF